MLTPSGKPADHGATGEPVVEVRAEVLLEQARAANMQLVLHPTAQPLIAECHLRKPKIAITPASVDLGKDIYLEPVQTVESFQIRSVGTAPLVLGSIKISGADLEVLSCPPPGTVLQPGTSADVEVAISLKSKVGPKEGTLQVQSNAEEPPAPKIKGTVGKGRQVIQWEDPAEIVYSTPLSAKQLSAKAQYENAKLTFAPDKNVVLVAGVHELKVTAAETANYEAAVKTVRIKVNKKEQVIPWTPGPIFYGDDLTKPYAGVAGKFEKPTLTYFPAKETKWECGDGQELRIEAAETENYLARSETRKINVKKAKQEITWAKPPDIRLGELFTLKDHLTAKAKFENPDLKFTPEAGTKALPAGKKKLKVLAKTTKNYLELSAEVEINILKAKQEVTWEPPDDIDCLTPLSDKQLRAKAAFDKPVITYDPKLGTKLRPGDHQQLKVTFGATNNYEAAESLVVYINVKKAKQEIVWKKPADIKYGTKLAEFRGIAKAELTATAKENPTPVYTPKEGALLTVGDNQTLSVYMPPTANYEEATATVTINVKRADQEITWKNPSDIDYGTPLSATQLNATAKEDPVRTYLTATGATADGVVLNAGDNHPLKVTTPETTNYEAGTTTVYITVKRLKQVLTLADPPPEVKPVTLAAGHFVTTHTVGDGVLSRSPAIGTVLAPATSDTFVLKAEVSQTVNYLKTTAAARIFVAESAAAKEGFEEAADGTSFIRPAALSAEKAILDAYDADTGSIKTDGTKLMKDLASLTTAEFKTYMDDLAKTQTGGLAANYVNQPGGYPNHIWKLNNGLQVRMKPSGDAYSAGEPMFCIEGKNVAGFTADQNQIVFKLTADGEARAKGPTETNNTKVGAAFTQFQDGSAAATHHKVRT